MADETWSASSAFSPLSGGYLLIVLSEPHSEQHKQVLLEHLAKGLASWDSVGTQIDIESELANIATQCPNGEQVRNGEKLIQLASDSLVTEILIQPQLSTLKQCMRNLLASFTRHRHVIHAGYTLSGSGSWILQDGTYDFDDFKHILQEPEIQRLYRTYESSITMDLHCADEGQWSAEQIDPAIKAAKISINPLSARESQSQQDAVNSFVRYISDILPSVTLDHLLEPSDVVGNIRFNHPTLYVFPGGQGDSALFGISGFNILIDGGFGRKPCFWDFTRHLDRLDAVVMTRSNASSLSGLTGAICRKASSPVYPQMGHIFCNLPRDGQVDVSEQINTADSTCESLTVNINDLCRAMSAGLGALQLKAQPIYRSATLEPINLYHKVGHGTLDMFIISPSASSPEVKELLRLWRSADVSTVFKTIKMGGKEFRIPLLDMVSVCALLVWQPSDPQEAVTRLLFPGSAPQHKILEGLDKFKQLEFLKSPVFMAKDAVNTVITPSSTSSALTKSPVKTKSTSSPRHTPIEPVKTMTVRKEVRSPPKAADHSKEADANKPRPAKIIKADVLNSSSRTGSAELRAKKTEVKPTTTAPMKSSTKKETTNGETNKPPVPKIKKDVANMKMVEARVHSFKSPASLKRAEEGTKNKKPTDDKDVKDKVQRSQSQSREKRSASSVRGQDEEKTRIKLVKKIEATPSSPAKTMTKPIKAKPKEAKPVEVKAAVAKEPLKKDKPKAKPATTSTTSSTPSGKAVKRPVKAAAIGAAATIVAVASVVSQQIEQEPAVVEEDFNATEAPQAASSPKDAAPSDDGQAPDETSLLEAIESQILGDVDEKSQEAVEDETEEKEEDQSADAEDVEEENVAEEEEIAQPEDEGTGCEEVADAEEEDAEAEQVKEKTDDEEETRPESVELEEADEKSSKDPEEDFVQENEEIVNEVAADAGQVDGANDQDEFNLETGECQVEEEEEEEEIQSAVSSTLVDRPKSASPQPVVSGDVTADAIDQSDESLDATQRDALKEESQEEELEEEVREEESSLENQATVDQEEDCKHSVAVGCQMFGSGEIQSKDSDIYGNVDNDEEEHVDGQHDIGKHELTVENTGHQEDALSSLSSLSDLEPTPVLDRSGASLYEEEQLSSMESQPESHTFTQKFVPQAEESSPKDVQPKSSLADDESSGPSSVEEEFKAEIVIRPVPVAVPIDCLPPYEPSPPVVKSPVKDISPRLVLDEEEDDGVEVEEEAFQQEIKTKDSAVPITPVEEDQGAFSFNNEPQNLQLSSHQPNSDCEREESIVDGRCRSKEDETDEFRATIDNQYAGFLNNKTPGEKASSPVEAKSVEEKTSNQVAAVKPAEKEEKPVEEEIVSKVVDNKSVKAEKKEDPSEKSFEAKPLNESDLLKMIVGDIITETPNDLEVNEKMADICQAVLSESTKDSQKSDESFVEQVQSCYVEEDVSKMEMTPVESEKKEKFLLEESKEVFKKEELLIPTQEVEDSVPIQTSDTKSIKLDAKAAENVKELVEEVIQKVSTTQVVEKVLTLLEEESVPLFEKCEKYGKTEKEVLSSLIEPIQQSTSETAVLSAQVKSQRSSTSEALELEIPERRISASMEKSQVPEFELAASETITEIYDPVFVAPITASSPIDGPELLKELTFPQGLSSKSEIVSSPKSLVDEKKEAVQDVKEVGFLTNKQETDILSNKVEPMVAEVKETCDYSPKVDEIIHCDTLQSEIVSHSQVEEVVADVKNSSLEMTHKFETDKPQLEETKEIIHTLQSEIISHYQVVADVKKTSPETTEVEETREIFHDDIKKASKEETKYQDDVEQVIHTTLSAVVTESLFKLDAKEELAEPQVIPQATFQLKCDSLPFADLPKLDVVNKTEQLKPETIDFSNISCSSSVSVTPKTPLSPNVARREVVEPPTRFEDDVISQPSSLDSMQIHSGSSISGPGAEKHHNQEDSVAMPTINYLAADYEGVNINTASKLSTIASSDGETDGIQPASFDSNWSSKTFDKLTVAAESSTRHQAEESAFSSGPSSWDEREPGARPYYVASESISDRSATSSIISHAADDEVEKLDHPSLVSHAESHCQLSIKKELNVSPAPSSPFSTDRCSSRGDFEANKDSLSSIQTSESSDYHLETKVDDSASAISSSRSDYSDDRSGSSIDPSLLQEQRLEQRSMTPRSDISCSSETTEPVTIANTTQLIQSVQQQTAKVELKASSKAELADPKLAPHNIWLKEKDTASSPNPFTDADDDTDHCEPLASSTIYYQQQQPVQHLSDIESDRHSDSQSSSVPVAEYTDEYYTQNLDYVETCEKSLHPHEASDQEVYLYESEHDDAGNDYHPYSTKYSDSYDDADLHYQTEEAINDDYRHIGDHQNGNSYHFYESGESASTDVGNLQYEDMNRNDRTPTRDALHPYVAPDGYETEPTVISPTSRQLMDVTTPAPQPQLSPQQQQHEDTLASWGKPLGLPAPVAPGAVFTSNGSPLKRPATNNGHKASDKATNNAASSSTPFYVDLAYIPHHSDPRYSDVDFFKRIRARHYVLSTLEPSAQVLDALLEGKQSWSGDDKDLDVTIIPTYDSDALATWVSANEDLLARNRIDLAPSASRCTINLQDHETSCSAYRLEF